MYEVEIQEALESGYTVIMAKDLKPGYEISEPDGFIFVITDVHVGPDEITTVTLQSGFSSYKSHQEGVEQKLISNEMYLAKPPTT